MSSWLVVENEVIHSTLGVIHRIRSGTRIRLPMEKLLKKTPSVHQADELSSKLIHIINKESATRCFELNKKNLPSFDIGMEVDGRKVILHFTVNKHGAVLKFNGCAP